MRDSDPRTEGPDETSAFPGRDVPVPPESRQTVGDVDEAAENDPMGDERTEGPDVMGGPRETAQDAMGTRRPRADKALGDDAERIEDPDRTEGD